MTWMRERPRESTHFQASSSAQPSRVEETKSSIPIQPPPLVQMTLASSSLFDQSLKQTNLKLSKAFSHRSATRRQTVHRLTVTNVSDIWTSCAERLASKQDCTQFTISFRHLR
ncbi:hypothetical protein BLNAU_14792 [Blattamonas nauphoetae]|uniref:Uncharacterized protein n=1 Tax=Blattamonas nauphoetae TaxID=2049346 RepID=A0ABQ9XFV1_9EUKA|nr:hypothetical protein BLNAU_14792 [Blattamonas nauphoetae]